LSPEKTSIDHHSAMMSPPPVCATSRNVLSR
jgi:hypothetical protein